MFGGCISVGATPDDSTFDSNVSFCIAVGKVTCEAFPLAYWIKVLWIFFGVIIVKLHTLKSAGIIGI